MSFNKTFYLFDPIIYPRNLWVSISPDINTIKKYFEISDKDEKEYINYIKLCNAIGFAVVEKKSNFQGILMVFRNKKDFTIKTIAHEATHIADYFYDEIGAYGQSYKDKNEPFCYLVGWAAECLGKVKNNI